MAAAGGVARQRIDKMSAEVRVPAQKQERTQCRCCAASVPDSLRSQVVDSNPYSRLMALQRMGVVADYERIRDKTVAIVVRVSQSLRKRTARKRTAHSGRVAGHRRRRQRRRRDAYALRHRQAAIV